MDRLQRNGGTAGIVAGVLLVVLSGLFFSLGLTPAEVADPAKALPVMQAKRGVLAGVAIAGSAASALGLLLAAGLMARLRDGAPTRAAAQFYFAVIGLSALALDGVIRWIGGGQLATATSDPVAAAHAYVALNAIGLGIAALGNAFIGVSLILVGWAIAATRSLSTILGWVGIAAGVVAVASVFAPPTAAGFFIASLVLSVVWLIWAGGALRSAAMR